MPSAHRSPAPRLLRRAAPLLILPLLVGACASARYAATGVRSLAKEGVERVDEASRNPSLGFAIKSQMIDDDRVRARDIDIAVDEGVVTLTGTQPSRAARDRAEQIAWSTPGVRKVINRIVVKPAGK